MERDVLDEWQFAKANMRKRVKFVPKLLVQGTEANREAGLAGCGIIRILGWSADDELRSGKLVRVLPDWECVGSLPMVAIYRRTQPMVPQVSVFVRHLADAFQCYNLPAMADRRGSTATQSVSVSL